jgi:polyferredoxin
MGILQNFIAFRYVPFYPIAVLTGLGLTFGRGWCGWFCPFGTFQDFVGIRKKKGSYPWVKYVVLGVVLVLAFVFREPLFCKICPAGTLEGTFPNILIGIATFNPASILHIIIFSGIAACSIYILRFWCRFLCPVGAIFGIFNRVTPLQIKLNETACVNCHRCSLECPQGLDVLTEMNSSDCIKCGKCLVCDALKLSYSLPKKIKSLN